MDRYMDRSTREWATQWMDFILWNKEFDLLPENVRSENIMDEIENQQYKHGEHE